MMEDSDLDRHLGYTYPEAATRLKVSVSSIKRRIRDGDLENYHVGRRAFVTAESVDRLAGKSEG